MNYILTTVGLSSLTNGLRGIFTPKEIYDFSNAPKEEIDPAFITKFDKEIETLKQEIVDFDDAKLKRLSAELNALLRLYKNGFDTQDFHKLLVTDTYLGKKAAELLETFLKSKGFNVDIYAPRDLRTSDLESFHLSLSEIVKDLSSELEGYKESGYKILFNLTGGFKSINSFMQSMASLWADESIYIFETSDELLTIPRLPLKIDNEIFAKNLHTFRMLEHGLPVEREKLRSIPKSLVIQINDEYTLSPWGEMAWQKAKLDLYKNLIDFEYIEYTDEFIKNFMKINDKERIQINKKLDLLDMYRRTNDERFNPSSLRFHTLKNVEKYSHEFYPFDGNDSRRAYCNLDGRKVIIEKIGDHL